MLFPALPFPTSQTASTVHLKHTHLSCLPCLFPPARLHQLPTLSTLWGSTRPADHHTECFSQPCLFSTSQTASTVHLKHTHLSCLPRLFPPARLHQLPTLSTLWGSTRPADHHTECFSLPCLFPPARLHQLSTLSTPTCPAQATLQHDLHATKCVENVWTLSESYPPS
ncbi:hypothetical protein L7F22_010462 [Adiantum nelumboides]|nr:hypothetical protein [Adiantum nelumboides]